MRARVAVLVLAVLVCAWFALQIRESRETDRVTAIISSSAKLSRAQSSTARSLLENAKLLNPDTAVTVLRARLALGEGDPAAARQILAGVLAQEPMNLSAWAWMVRASQDDPHERLIAFAHVLQLVPKVPPPP
jgi:uncharacterized protein HemY